MPYFRVMWKVWVLKVMCFHRFGGSQGCVLEAIVARMCAKCEPEHVLVSLCFSTKSFPRWVGCAPNASQNVPNSSDDHVAPNVLSLLGIFLVCGFRV